MRVRDLTAKYPGDCKRCGKAVSPGSRIAWVGRGQTYHWDCWNNDNPVEPTTTSHDEQEIAQGIHLADHLRATRNFFGEEAAMAEELAWEMKLGDGY